MELQPLIERLRNTYFNTLVAPCWKSLVMNFEVRIKSFLIATFHTSLKNKLYVSLVLFGSNKYRIGIVLRNTGELI